MHPEAPHDHDVLRDSADDHGSNPRPPGPVEEQDSAFWMKKAKQAIEGDLLKRAEIKGVAKNVIIFMGDGMSVPTLAATRMYLGNENEQLSFEKFPVVGLSKTYCVDTQTADSACSATAYLCGVKANMGTMGVSAKVPRHNCTEQKDSANHVDSVLAWGMEAGKWAGVVTTTRITHASPGGTYAHTANRDWEDDKDMTDDKDLVGEGCKDIARQLVEDAPGKDFRVIMGGGRRAFIPKEQHANGKRQDGKNLVDAWKASKSGAQSSYVATKTELAAVDASKTDYLLGLFEWSHVQYHLDADETQPTLAEMVEKAIQVLSRQEKGYVLFVEGGRIDHGHHDTMAHYALDETAEFSKAIQKAVDMTSASETLIAVTSDHAHTMSMAGYAKRSNYIFDFGGVEETSKEVYTTLSYANGPGYKPTEEDGTRHDPSKDDRNKNDYEFPATAYLNSETHGADDVGIFARGPWAHLYTGVHEQNMIPNIAAYAAAIGPFKGRSDSGDNSGAVSVQVALLTLLSAAALPLARLL